QLFSFFPAAWMACVVLAVVNWIAVPGSLFRFLAVPAIVYLLPVACFRLHEMKWPLTEGKTRLDDENYVPWWGAHQMQVMYTAFPALDAALRLVPGVYSAWLRLWGSRIGRDVHWTPLVEITDRSMLE